MEWLSNLLDQASNFFANRKGLLPVIGILLVLLNLIFKIFIPGWFSQTDLFLHIGIIVIAAGMMLAWAL